MKNKKDSKQLAETDMIKICFEYLAKIYGDNATDVSVEQIVMNYASSYVDISFNTRGVSLKTKAPLEDSENRRVCKRFGINAKSGCVDSMTDCGDD